MSRSYETDDRVFQKLRAAGKTSWDEQSDPQASFDKSIMRPFLEESLAGIAEPLDGLSALLYRRLLTAENMMMELGEMGFTIQHHREVAQKDPRKPVLMQIRAGLPRA